MTVRAKFRCTTDTHQAGYGAAPQHKYHFAPTYQPDLPEDQRFAKATPQGEVAVGRQPGRVVRGRRVLLPGLHEGPGRRGRARLIHLRHLCLNCGAYARSMNLDRESLHHTRHVRMERARGLRLVRDAERFTREALDGPDGDAGPEVVWFTGFTFGTLGRGDCADGGHIAHA